MRPCRKTLCHAMNARTCASLARMYMESGDWEDARMFADKARASWLRIKWETPAAGENLR